MAHIGDLRKAMLRGSAPLPKRRDGTPVFSFGKKDYSPVPAMEYFGKARFITVGENDTLYLYETETHAAAPYLLFLHGGGYSGLTWAPLIKQLQPMFTAEFGAVDVRGHGRSSCENEADLSTDRVTEDLFQLVQKLNLGSRPLILIGHSMGGAFAIHLSSRLQDESDINLQALIVIDVVEGSALESLSGMQHVLRNRPREFASLQTAIEWCIRSGQTRNTESARVSMPGQLKLLSGEIPEATMVDDQEIVTDEPISPQFEVRSSPIAEEPMEITTENQEQRHKTGRFQGEKVEMKAPSTEKYVWRIDLKKTEPFWRGWFEGLSTKFLTIRAPKLLLLAGVDRLDKELMVAQMQGKFQMQVLSSVGHIVHEDAPDRVAENIASFLARNKIITTSEGIPRVFPGC